jgi:predicted ATPase
VLRELATQYLALAERTGAPTPLLYGHRTMGISLLLVGEIAKGQAHLDRTISLYDPIAHRPLSVRFGQDVGVAVSSFRSLARWLMGCPAAALADVDRAIKDAREIGHAATLMYAQAVTSLTLINCGHYARASSHLDEVVVLAEEKGTLLWKAAGTALRGCILALTGMSPDAIRMINSGLTAWRSTGSTLWVPFYYSCLARAHADLAQNNDASRWIGEATLTIETNKEKWCEAKVNRVAGEIALKSPEPDTAKAQAYFERALAVARAQQAKSWELRAAMSMARLWRDQGKRDEARDLLAPVYGWFTEGFDTFDLKDAKALLDELVS